VVIERGALEKVDSAKADDGEEEADDA